MARKEDQQAVYHLYRRAGFGWRGGSQTLSKNRVIRSLFEESKLFDPLELVEAAPVPEVDRMDSTMSTLEKQRLQKENRERISKLNISWMNAMAKSQGVLREKMALFWHNHFACRSDNPVMVERYINVLRKNALGNFGTMLMEVSKEPAMLSFLNNQQNRKGKPNENFAREVMELFTLGHGNYSETDIKEAARAFTGWAYSKKIEFEFREKSHDGGEKILFKQRGNFRGEDVIRILLEQKQTARYVVGKICRTFVGLAMPEAQLEKLANYFFSTGYDIEKLMRRIFESRWFYDTRWYGTIVKSPVELLIEIQGTLHADFVDEKSLLYVQKVLGQVLFYPPNVAGWPGGLNWIDNSSLLFRMQIPEMMSGNVRAEIKAKNDGDVNTQVLNQKAKSEKAKIDWQDWAKGFEKYASEELVSVMINRLLPLAPKQEVISLLTKSIDSISDRTLKIRALTVSIMSLPEYQLS